MDEHISGECHRFPPYPYPDGAAFGEQILYPKVGPQNWCGEWEEKP
ncbi:hypothetical protein LCGC14_0653660 [marine sediment metagenome]|uniref:Uncharacterized protein n=1 Tax=marine sediment metagenome TaxID=412755 RepID=A0A0F9TH92_9ZZZZ